MPAVLSGARISMGVGGWRSQVPSVNSPECVEGESSEGRRFLGALTYFVPWRTYTPPG